MIYSVKEFGEVNIDCKASAFLDIALYLLSGLLPIPVRFKSKTMLEKIRSKWGEPLLLKREGAIACRIKRSLIVAFCLRTAS